jgi:hypothetical protein
MEAMSNKTLFYFTIAVLFGIAALFAINLASIMTPTQPEPVLKYDFVRGMAAQHADKLYTLNFEQQNQFIEIINRAIPNKEIVGDVFKRPFIEKIVIYQFNEPNIEILPVAQVGQNLVLKINGKEGYLKDVSDGALKTLLFQTINR